MPINPYAPFLQDYSGAAGAGAAFQGFTEGLNKAQDMSMKRMELQARLNAQQSQVDREKALTMLEARKQGGSIGADGSFVQGQITPQQQTEYALKMGAEGTKPVDKDQYGYPTEVQFDPNSQKAIHEQNIADKNLAMIGLAGRNQDRQDQRLGMQQHRLDVNSNFKANSQYQGEMSDTETQLLGANKAQALIQRIKNGDLKSNPSLRGDLSAALASLINQGKPATVYGMQHQDFDSAWGRASGALGFISGKATNTLTPDLLGQLEKDIGAIKGEIGIQHQTRFGALDEGLPQQYRQNVENRFHKFRQGAGLETLPSERGAGLVGAPGGSLGAVPQQQAAPDPLQRLKELRQKAGEQ